MDRHPPSLSTTRTAIRKLVRPDHEPIETMGIAFVLFWIAIAWFGPINWRPILDPLLWIAPGVPMTIFFISDIFAFFNKKMPKQGTTDDCARPI